MKFTQKLYHSPLLYSDEAQGEYLPNTHNGLGLKNLIKIEFQLTEFVNSLRDLPRCVPLLFIEEPESHMHPQLQKLFTRYLGTFMSHKMEGRDTQIFITSHSPHIANTMEFANIRYVKRCKDNVTFKVLSEFSASESDRRALSKYLNLIFCDVFFADKIILVEGLAEQILLPDMINKCQVTGDFNHPRRPYMRSNAPVSPTYPLPYQYYSIIPVGGSHAYKLLPLIHFLEVPCLVLTDIDAFKYDSSAPKQEQLQILPVKNCNVTTNPTLKYWINNECRMNIPYQLKETSEDSFEDKNRTFLPLGNFIDDDFINLNVHQNMHIAYQTPEYQHNSQPGYRHRRWIEVDKERWGRSFEEAILWACSDEQAEKLDKHFREHRIDFKGSKTDFALNIIFNNLDYTVPRYIREGLQWLNDAGEY